MAEMTAEVVTSPRKLPLPAPEDHASGISMKQYADEINGLRKENFHLKLQIYEQLGSGSQPVQGLLEQNLRLQVKVKELRRQLSDKQEFLAAAAEAIDVLEQQYKKEDTCAESESVGYNMGVIVMDDNLDELVKLRRENREALLQMIKGCIKRIQQQDKEKIKLNKEQAFNLHVSYSQMEKYEEILKCKDEHIKDLENKVIDLQKKVENVHNDDTTGNLQQLLTRRLQGLAYFLDKLLSHTCVLGEDKKKLTESILEQSLALPVGLKLDESMASEDFTMDESDLDISHTFRCRDENNRYSLRTPSKHYPQADVVSECWSEPGRNVSLARVGFCDTGLSTIVSTSDNNKIRARRSRVSYDSWSEDNKTVNETLFLEDTDQNTKRKDQLGDEINDLKRKLDHAMSHIDELIVEGDVMKNSLDAKRASLKKANKSIAVMTSNILSLESKTRDLEGKLTEAVQLIEKLRAERQELESAHLETERSLRRATDEATVQVSQDSQAALEQARAQHD